MEILILKDGQIYARTNGGEGEYEIKILSDDAVPPYPTDNPGRGKRWELKMEGDTLIWAAVDRPFTPEERIESLEEEIDELRYPEFKQPTGAHDSYRKGDGVTFKGCRYVSLIDDNVWSPEAYPAGWEAVLL